MIVERDFENERKMAATIKPTPKPIKDKVENQTDASFEEEGDISNILLLSDEQIKGI